jgi:alpha-glucoside transport system substrate-binding protein
MSKRVLTFLVVVSLISVVGLLGFSQQKVTIAVVWSGAELEAFEKALIPFEQETGIDVVVESVGRDLPAVLVTRVAAGNPPDVTGMPNPGQMKEFADQGALIALTRQRVMKYRRAGLR